MPRGGVFKDIAGERFGLLTAVKLLPSGKWLCSCECGGSVERNGRTLRYYFHAGRRQSCGCRHKDRIIKYAATVDGELLTIAEIATLLGMTRKPLYRWAAAGKLNESHIKACLAKRRAA